MLNSNLLPKRLRVRSGTPCRGNDGKRRPLPGQWIADWRRRRDVRPRAHPRFLPPSLQRSVPLLKAYTSPGPNPTSFSATQTVKLAKFVALWFTREKLVESADFVGRSSLHSFRLILESLSNYIWRFDSVVNEYVWSAYCGISSRGNIPGERSRDRHDCSTMVSFCGNYARS